MRRLRAVGALTVLLALLVGVPAALAGTIGDPTTGLSDLLAGDVTDTVLIGLLAGIAWIAWAQFALATVVELASALRRAPVPRRIPGVLSGQQHLARSLVTAILLLGPVVASTTLTPGALTHLPGPTGQVRISATLTTLDTTAPPAAQPPPPGPATVTPAAPAPVTTVYTVPPAGQGPATLWDIAQTHLGSGDRWHEIWQLNEGRAQPSGARLTSPRRLLPGWTLLVPVQEPINAQAAPAAGQGAGTQPAASTSPVEVTVERGDTLSALAAEHGQADWHPAWQANAGRLEPGGARYTDPDLIRPGWRLTIPAGAPAAAAATPTAPAPTTPPAGPPAEQPPPTPAPSQGATPTAAPSTPAASGTSAAPAVPAVPTVPGAAGTAPWSTAPSPAETAAPSRPAADPAAPAVQPAGRSLEEVLAFTGGGVLLAASMLEALRRRRRRRFRDRTLGRTISSTPAELAPMEKALLARGAAGAPDVQWLHTALSSLAQTLAAEPDGALPDVVAVRLGAEVLELVLTTARRQAPAPWQADGTGLRWSVGRHDRLTTDPARHLAAPYPTLATVGHTADGEFWLLDLERVGALSLTGDSARCLGLARFLAAELAHNAWSDQLLVTLVGFGAELAGLNPSRVLHRASAADAVRDAHATLRETAQVLQDAGTDVLEGRLRTDLVGDGWSPHVLLVAPDPEPDPDALQALLDGMRAQRSRTAVALVLAADTQHCAATRWQVHLDSGGTLTIPELDVQLTAQQLPVEEAADLAALLQLAADSPDQLMPPAAGDEPWDAFCDAAGAPRQQYTARRPRDDEPAVRPAPQGTEQRETGPALPDPEGVSSVLPLAVSAYLPTTATTAEDVAALAPAVSPQVRRHVEDADPTLDEDLALWHDACSGIAKLTLLGRVGITGASGTAPTNRSDRIVEVVAFLACRPQGVRTRDWLAQWWPAQDNAPAARARAYANTARQWLGKDPRTGGDYLPRATEGPGNVGLYRLRGVLVDADLFRRLRLRGVARGTAGLADLQAALDLVTGEPLSHGRDSDSAWSWLVDNPVDHAFTAMVVDVAHLVATHHLSAGAPHLAEAAARVALLAGATDDVALLDLVAVKDATGEQAQAEQYVARILRHHHAEVEEDLPPRTYEVLRRRRWLPKHDARAS